MKHLKAWMLLFCAAAAVYYWSTDGFYLARIKVPLLESIDPLAADVLIPNSFHYLGKGHQTFVFESGNIVLKLFDANHLKEPWRESKKAWWRERIRIYPESYPLAYRLLQKQTGVLLVHLGKSDRIFPTIELVDKIGRRFQLDLNSVPFVLQTKGKNSFYQSLKTAAPQDRKQLIDAYLAFQQQRIELCIADHDRDIEHNYCWDGKILQYIDPARCFFEPSLKEDARRKKEWWKATHRLRMWLDRYHPEELVFFDEEYGRRAS